MSRTVIDPVTRAGGQLRIEADTSAGAVTHAWVSATMFRGIERVLVGRDPRDAWLMAQRVCGTCTGVHALASVRAVENALGIVIPRNARLIRNVMAGTLLVRDHAMVLYQRALPDWVDFKAAAAADPVEASRLAKAASAWPNSGSEHLKAVRDRIAGVIDSGQPGPFGGDWWGHPAYAISPEQSLVLVSHMLDALDWQRDFMRIEALLGGKDPHPQTYLVGGMSLAPPWGGPAASKSRQHPQVPDHNAPLALSTEGLDLVGALIADARKFVEQVLVPDTLVIAAAYPEYATLGGGSTSFLSFGEYPQDEAKSPTRLMPNGRLVGGRLQASLPADESGVSESVLHSWYAYSNGDDALRRPFEGELNPQYTGSVPLKALDTAGKYSWIKAARYDGIVTETGPLARVLVGAANGQNETRLALAKILEQTGLPQEALESTIGRFLARAVEAQVMVRQLDGWVWGLRTNLSTGDVAIASVEMWDQASWPSEADGHSIGEGPRGSVGHWMSIKDGRVSRYQIVDGSTFNASPRDALSQAGPLEIALVGAPVADPARPVELMRIVHSLAPCAACAAHVISNHAGTGPVLRVHAAEAVR
ncbi:MAG: nickel-dependent hydrogenase large subunit [Chloroflexota bacterium]